MPDPGGLDGIINWAVIIIIVAVGLLILYRALKEPLDMLFGFIGRGLGAVRDKIMGMKDTGGDYYDEIRYG